MKKSKMKSFPFILALTFSAVISAQSDVIEIFDRQNESSVTIMAVNHLEERQEITLEMDTVNLSGYEGPITRLVATKDTVVMAELQIKEQKPWQYATQHEYRPRLTTEEIKNAKEVLFSTIDGLGSGIAVFTKQGCTRSSFATDYLKRKKTDFKKLDISNNDFNKRVLSKLLNLDNPDIGYYRYPVILVDGELSHSIEDLKGFMKSLVLHK